MSRTPSNGRPTTPTARIRLIAGGERAGKSRSAAMELVGRFLEGQLYWLVGPDYDLCRPEFAYLIEALESLDAIETLAAPTGQSSRLLLRNGTLITTRTAQRAMRLAGQAPDGILGCEAAQLSYESFLRMSGRLAERRGWLWLSGTFEGSRGWYAEKFRAWQSDNPDQAASFSIPSWSNRTLFPGGREDPEIERLALAYPADLFQERLGGVPCPPVSLVFREFHPAAHVRTIKDPYESFDNIEIAVDPGYAGSVCRPGRGEAGRGGLCAGRGVHAVRDCGAGDPRVQAKVLVAVHTQRGDRHCGAAASCGAEPDPDLGGAGQPAAALAPGVDQRRNRPAANVPSGSGERRTADHDQPVVPGINPGVRELPLSRTARESTNLRIADRRGQSRDQGAVLLAV